MKLPAYNPEGFWRLKNKPCYCICGITTYDTDGNVNAHYHAVFLGRRAVKKLRRELAAAKAAKESA